MSRYIDADKLLTTLLDDLPYKASVKRVLMQAPTADVVEVRHGEWKLGKSGVMYFCSFCGYAAHPREEEQWNFCPNCGAKMDGGKDDGT